MSTIIIAISQGKGGSAKTTTSVNLAGAFYDEGYRVILFDWDDEKPDAVAWANQGKHIDWVRLIDKDDPLKDIEKYKNECDVIIIDTPPNFEKNAFKAVMAADYVIIPSSTNFLDEDNTKKAISLPMLAKKPFKILMSKIKKGTKEGKIIHEKTVSKDISFSVVVTERNVVAQCPREGMWVGQFAKGSDSHMQFKQLMHEVIDWTGLKCNIKNKNVESIGV